MNFTGYEAIAIKSQDDLKQYATHVLENIGYTVYSNDGYVLGIPNTDAINIMLTAHMDIVTHLNPLKKLIVEKHTGRTILSAPKEQYVSGDDRVGCFIILSILASGKRPYVLFCEDEEKGDIGAHKFAKDKSIDAKKLLENVQYILEIDRRNGNDIVYYDCGNEDFQKYIEDNLKDYGYKKNYGSMSDISVLSPYLDVASCNLSCGYYEEHTYNNYIVWEELVNCFNAVCHLLSLKSDTKYDYQENDDYYGRYGYGWGDDDVEMQIGYVKNHQVKTKYYSGASEEEIIGSFLIEHPNLTYNDLILDYFL